ncbi:hypothetical protein E5K00_17360 [Hymenobacter aquaticus]|uniref:Uncharacterized protein n=1 Tax=Hymenobacter aquaticus TaxID=1867101 RepID=A0A4Z0PYN3_9BACT|nr:hypothetical protein [Hymenobacter aquaticus]TGE22021.1 hypothetical protein E5K00_17360 [Hymenobacter aquaticus]
MEEDRYEQSRVADSALDSADSQSGFYDWRVLVILVSCSHTAWHVVVEEGEKVGEDDYLLGYPDRILRAPQVRNLSTALASALAEMPENPAAASDELLPQTPAGWELLEEDDYLPFTGEGGFRRAPVEEASTDLTERKMQEELQRFIQKAAAANQALLILG